MKLQVHWHLEEEEEEEKEEVEEEEESNSQSNVGRTTWNMVIDRWPEWVYDSGSGLE